MDGAEGVLTPLVTLRPVEATDALYFNVWSQDIETRYLQGARVLGHTPQSAVEEVERILAGQGKTHHAFMIEADGRTVGNCWLGHLDADSASLGIVIGDPKCRNLGIGTEAVRQLLAFAEANGIHRVKLWTLGTNERAIHVYRKLGFVVTDATSIRDLPLQHGARTLDMEWRSDANASTR